VLRITHHQGWQRQALREDATRGGLAQLNENANRRSRASGVHKDLPGHEGATGRAVHHGDTRQWHAETKGKRERQSSSRKGKYSDKEVACRRGDSKSKAKLK